MTTAFEGFKLIKNTKELNKLGDLLVELSNKSWENKRIFLNLAYEIYSKVKSFSLIDNSILKKLSFVLLKIANIYSSPKNWKEAGKMYKEFLNCCSHNQQLLPLFEKQKFDFLKFFERFDYVEFASLLCLLSNDKNNCSISSEWLFESKYLTKRLICSYLDLKHITSLTLLNCSHIFDKEFDQISGHTDSLEYINFSKSKMSEKTFSNFILRNSSLKVIKYSHFSFKESDPFYLIFSNCKNIEEIDFSSSYFEILTPKLSNKYYNLKKLDLSNCKIKSQVLFDVLKCVISTLQDLNISNIKSTNENILNLISKDQKVLHTLKLSDCNLKTKEMRIFVKNFLPFNSDYSNHLEHNGNHQSTPLKNEIVHHPSVSSSNLTLVSIDFSFSLISSNNLNRLFKNTQNIEKVVLSHCSLLENSTISLLKKYKLKHLDISCCEQISKDVIKQVLPFFSQKLEVLNLSYLPEVDDEVIEKLSCGFKNLKSLNIAQNQEQTKITENSIVSISTGCPNLVLLDLSFSSFQLPECFKQFSSFCTKIETLILKGTSFNSEALEYVSGGLHYISHLDLSFAPRLGSVSSIAFSMPYLKKLNLESSNFASNIEEVAKMPSLVELNIYNCKNANQLTLNSILSNSSLRLLKIGGTNKLSEHDYQDFISKKSENLVVIDNNKPKKVIKIDKKLSNNQKNTNREKKPISVKRPNKKEEYLN